MPAGNQLIRIKVIDECLRNRFSPYPCTLERMRKLCSEELREIRGREEDVSARTIMDDLQVMRDVHPGFEAPIKYNGTEYYYADKYYSVFHRKLEMDELFDLIKNLH